VLEDAEAERRADLARQDFLAQVFVAVDENPGLK